MPAIESSSWRGDLMTRVAGQTKLRRLGPHAGVPQRLWAGHLSCDFTPASGEGILAAPPPIDREALTCSSLAATIPTPCRSITDNTYTPTTHHGSKTTPPTRCKATPPHNHPGNTICLLPMSTRIRCHCQRNDSRAIHRADDPRSATHLAPSFHPTAFIQAP